MYLDQTPNPNPDKKTDKLSHTVSNDDFEKRLNDFIEEYFCNYN